MSSDLFSVRTVECVDRLELLHARVRRHQFPLHFHETFVIEWVVRGSDVCKGPVESHRARSGQLLVHTPGAIHAGGPADGECLEYRAMYPSSRLFSQLTGTCPNEIPRGRNLVVDNPPLTRLAASVLNRLSGHLPSSVASCRLSEFLKRIFDVIVQAPRSPEQHTRCQPVEAARQLIIGNPADAISVADLASICGLSRAHFIRQFRGQYGITPRQFLISQRVCHAEQQMSQGAPVAAAATAAGFADQSHLTRCFRKVRGYTPGRFLRGNRQSTFVQD